MIFHSNRYYLKSAMMLRSSDNTDHYNEEYHHATGLETPTRSQLPPMLSITQVEFDERVADPTSTRLPHRGSHATAPNFGRSFSKWASI